MKWTGQAQVLVETKRNFIALTKSLQVGSVIEEGDVAIYESDWGSGFEQAFDNVDQVVGKTLTRSLVAGAPLTLNSIRQTSVIKSGDRVRVLMVGKNFSVSGEGVAMSSAAAGDQVKVRMGSGQSVSGLAVRAGVVQINIE
jgi:flagella basal body P-ring formation protein FlgA